MVSFQTFNPVFYCRASHNGKIVYLRIFASDELEPYEQELNVSFPICISSQNLKCADVTKREDGMPPQVHKYYQKSRAATSDQQECDT